MVLGKLPVPGRPTILSRVGQGPIALAVGAGGGGLDIFTFIYPFFSFSLSLGDGPIYTEILSQRAVKPKTTNQPTEPGQETITKVVWSCLKVFWFSEDNSTGHSERKKRKRLTEIEVRR